VDCRFQQLQTAAAVLVSFDLMCDCSINHGQYSSVSIVNRYRLDGPGIESRWERDFLRLSRLALGPTQPPIQWVPGLSRG
jgi:hypothetical protein